MVVMEFSKGGKALSLTAMQMGPKVKVSADGSGLVMANAKSGRQGDGPGASASNEPAPRLPMRLSKPRPIRALPVPKQAHHALDRNRKDARQRRAVPQGARGQRSRRRSIRCSSFYRSELGKRGWQETAEGAIVKPDQVQLAFTSPDGPATLKLGRSKDETSINLAQKYPAAAAKADVVPKPGQSKLMFGNIGKSEATVSINKQTIKIAAGAGGPQSPRPPMIDLPPGKYQYALKIAGGPARNNQIEIGAGDTWGVMIGPMGEVLPLQMY